MAKKMTKKKKRTIIIAAVAAVLAIAAVLYFVLKPDEKVKIETVEVSRETINETLDTTGTVSAGAQDVFTLPNGVKILSLNVKEGDTVKAGQLIATFDTSSLDETLSQKKMAYDKAQAAYVNAAANSKGNGGQVAELKKQIAELEKEVADIEAKTEKATSTTTTAAPQKTEPKKEPVKISDSLVKRFSRLSKLFGVEYSEDMARTILTNMLSAGSSTNDISSMLDNLGQLSSMSGSFDMSAFSGMTGSTNLISAQANLVQLKSQLALLEVQSDESYVATFKTIADKTKESYETTKTQVDAMKDGWKAKKDGIISEINVSTDGAGSAPAAQSFDISSILSAVTSGGDVTSMLSSFMNPGTAAVKVLYYPLVADIALSKYDVLDVSLDQAAVIKTASGMEIDGKVSYISAVASNSNGLNINSLMGSSGGSSATIPAQVTINGADSSVIVGVDVNVSIITDTKENTIVVPVEAICIDNEEVFVYLLKDGVAVKKNVELGISNDTYYEVLSGVSLDDVLIKNTSGLEDGVKVELKSEAK